MRVLAATRVLPFIAVFAVVAAIAVIALWGWPGLTPARAQAGGTPVADAGYDRTVTPGATVMLDGTRSTDPEGDMLTLSWSFVSVPTGSAAVLANPTWMKPTFTADLAGNYVIQLVVNDGTSNSAPDTVTISTDNSAPVAAAGRDRAVQLGQTVQLDGSASWDPDGDGLSFAWTLVSAPAGSAATLSDAAAMQPTLVPDLAGDYVAELVVSDGVRASDPATVTLSTGNVAPVADAGNDEAWATYPITEPVIPDGHRSTDANGDTLSYQWSIKWRSDPLAIISLTDDPKRRATFTADRGGMFVLQLITNDGLTSSPPDTMVVRVAEGGNLRPVANAGPDQSVAAGATVQLDSTESYDIEGDPLSLRWSLTTKPAGSTAVLTDGQSARPTFDADLAGTYVAQLIVNDGKEDSVADTVVIGTGNLAPVANAGPDQRVAPSSPTIQLDGSGSTDANGDVLTYRWSLIERPAGSAAALSDPAAASPTFVADLSGTYIAQLYVSDGVTESGPDRVIVTASAAEPTYADNGRPVADAGPDQAGIVLGATVQLDGSGSTDLEGGGGGGGGEGGGGAANLTYRWSLTVKPAGSATTMLNAHRKDPTFVADVGGLYVAQLVVKDDLSLYGDPPDTVVISVANQPPVANAGPDQSRLVGETVALDGTGSSDPNGDPLNYSWTVTGKPTGSTVALSGAATATPSFVPDYDGSYSFELVVDDGEFASAPDSVTVTASNQPPVLDPIGPQTVDLGSTLTIQLTATDPNPGTAPVFTAAPLPLPANASLDAATGLFTFRPDDTQVGTYNLIFAVTDGLLSDSESVSITVNGAPVGGTTAISGRVLDTNDYVVGTTTPVAGVTVSVIDAPAVTTVTDANGYFTLSGIPSGLQVLDLDTGTANLAPDGSTYAGFREEITLIADVTNQIDRPFYLPRIEADSLTTVSTTADVTVTNARLGVSMLVTAGNARNPDGTPFEGQLSISEVPLALAPASLPDLLKPGLLVTIQPVGVTFLEPAPITFPNIDNLAVGKQADLWSLDAASGAFSIVGTQEVSVDGTQLTTVPGSGGIRAADWHAPLPPEVLGTDNDPDKEEPCGCDAPSGSATSLHTGNLKETHSLVGYSSAGQGHSLQFVYNSTAADPRVIIKSDIAFPVTPRLVVPNTVSTTLSVAGVAHGGTLFTDASTLSRTGEEALRVAAQLDAGDLTTGVHQFEKTIMSNFAVSSAGTRRIGQVRVRNERNSPIGAGWTLSGLDRLLVGTGSAILVGGSGGMSRYFEGARFDVPIGSGGPDEVVTGARMAFADFNRDNKLDVAVPELVWNGNFQVHIYLGDGIGAFPTHLLATIAPPGYTGYSVDAGASYVGDFNEDGIADLVTVLARDPTYTTSSSFTDLIAVSLGNGDGTFQAATVLDGLYEYARDAAIGDFDGDLHLDIAVTSGTSGRIKLFFGDGSGAFPLARRTETPDYGINTRGFGFIRGQDVDRDGDLDFIVSRSLSNRPEVNFSFNPDFLKADSLLVFKNDGAGLFAAPAAYAAGIMSASPYLDPVEVADLNGDLYPDIAVNESFDRSLSVFLNDGAGGFLPRIAHAMEGAWVGTSTIMTGLSAADFNRDGHQDLVAGRFWFGDTDAMMVFDGAGDGNFSLSGEIDVTPLSGNFVSRNIGADDYDGDGYPDLLTISEAYGSTASVWVFPGLQSDEVVYNSPDSDYSKLFRNPDGTFTRTLRSGTKYQFDANGYQTAVTDLTGRTTSYAYDLSNRIKTITDAAGLVTTFNYVGAHLDNIIDPAGRVTQFQYDAAGNLIRITDPDDTFRQFAYDPHHRLVSQTDKRGFSKTYEYDSFGRHLRSVWPDGTERLMTAVQTAGLPDTAAGFGSSSNPAPAVRPAEATGSFLDGNGNTEIRKTNRFGFITERTVAAGTPDERTIVTDRDENNNVTSIVEPERTTYMSYDTNGLLKTRLVYDKRTDTVPYSTYNQWRRWIYTYNALNKVETVDGPRTDVPDITTYEYDPVTGNLIRTTNALGHVTEITAYNTYGQPLTMVDANGVETTLTYYPEGWLQSRTTDSGVGGTPATTSFTYDGAGNMTSTTLPDGSTLTYEYDGMGRVKAVENGAGERMEYTYDAAGNRTRTDVRTAGAPGAILRTASAVFDDLGRMLKSLGAYVGEETLYEYDGNGNMVRVTDPLGNVTQTAFDALNRVLTVTDALSGVASYSYDAAGNRETATDQRGLVTSYVHNGFGEVIQQTSPDTGVTVFKYDSAGNRIERTDARGVVTNWTYDALGRPLTMTFPANPAENVTYAYDDATPGNYGIGRLASVTDDSGSTSYVYDADGSVVQETHVIGAQTYVTEYSYDAADRLASMTYPSGRIVEYGRDALGRVTSVTTRENAPATPVTLASGASYEPFGGLDGLTYGNGVTLALAHDLNGRMTAVDLFDGATPVLDLDYDQYDLAGNIRNVTDAAGGSRGRTYVYDDLHRLTGASGGIPAESYTWDAVGNRETRDVGGTPSNYVYDTLSNRLLSATEGGVTRNLTYSASGNTEIDDRAAAADRSFAYDSTDRLISVTEGATTLATYLHDAQGQRVAKTAGGATTHYIYDLSGRLIAEADGGTGATTAEYVALEGMNLAFIATGSIYYVHGDHLGTPQMLTDGTTAAIAWDASYAPFGEATVTGALTFNQRFPGQYEDDETGLHYNYFRDYDAALGRYVQSDPIGLRGGWNTYAYVAGNPILLVDPKGMQTKVIITYSQYGGVELGDHTAVYIDNGGSPILYDPAGGAYCAEDEYGVCERGSGDTFYDEAANLTDYVKSHYESGSSRVVVYVYNTTTQEEAEIAERISQLGGTMAFWCASSVRTVISGIGPFKSLFSGGVLPDSPGFLDDSLNLMMRRDNERAPLTDYVGIPM